MWKSKTIKLALVSLVIITMLLAGGCFNKPPVITSLTPSATEVARGGSCTVNCVATDQNTDDTLTYAWSASGGSISGTGSTVTWTAPTTEGSYTVTVTVSDGKESVSDSCNITVVNTPPVITSLTPSTTDLPPEGSTNISCVASDADGDSLTYSWSATGGTVVGTGNSVSWEAPVAEGTYTVSVEVSDGHGGTVSDSVDIVVEIKYGSIDIQSDPAGAAVFLNDVDTGNITPFVITNLDPGSYTVELRLYHFKYRQQTVTVTPNETTYINWSLTPAPELTLSIQPDDTDGKDNYVYDPTPNDNYGNANDLYAGARAAGICRSYLQFSIDAIPDDVVILNARLGVYYFYNAPFNPVQIGAYTVLGAWSETASDWNNQPVFATVPVGSYGFPDTPTGDYHFIPVTAMVRDWYDGSQANFGMVLKSDDEGAWEGWVGFYSSDAIAARRPVLVITYFDPNP
jgi:hypothetical protein